MIRYVPFSLFFFLSLFFVHFVLSELPPTQRTTMINLSELLHNSSGFFSSWDINKNPNPCSWIGVSCSPNNISITHLSLSGSSLSSTDFLPLVCQIDTLQSIDLSNNHIGSIPNEFITACGGIDGLKLLNFSRNKLIGSLPNFSIGFVNLELLDLSHNSLSGNISLQLGELVKLKSLNLNNNQFSGFVPTQLGKSLILEKLELSRNLFHGEIPKEITNYRNLSLIDLSANKLSGKIPERFIELSKLEILILSQNTLSGEIPEFVSSIRTLTRFAANQNYFTGEIPPGITLYLRNLDLSYNSLNGTIRPDLLSRPNLQFLDLSNNHIEGSLPESMSPSLVRLRLGGNSLSGEIPKSFESLQELTYLELEFNLLSGMIPSELGFCQNLALLSLAHNNLTGALPPELGNLTNLQELKLQSNNLFGEIPIPITRLGSLRKLNISFNSLSGSIPSSVSNLQSLANLDLQSNNLSGVIPESLGGLSSLLELQLGKNRLSGIIPRMPWSLQIALNLSSNLFEGSIPETLSRLRSLEVLDLSNNRFSGEIPESLTAMESLTQLFLSNNHLSGVLPVFHPYTVVYSSGNKELVYVTTNPPPPSAFPKKRRTNLVTILVVLFAVVLAAGIVALVTLLMSRILNRINDEQVQPQEDTSQLQVIRGNLLTGNGSHRSNIDYIKAMEAVANPSNIFLKTRFSTYYKAVMPSGKSYCVKELNWSDKIVQLGSHERFEEELKFFGKLSHSNVMAPLAYVLTVDKAFLFYAYAEKGTLFDVLHGSLGDTLDWSNRYSTAIGVAQGLVFLHGCSSGPLLLLDLSSKSILLKSLTEPQVGEIELYRVIDPSKSTGSFSAVAGTVGYIPPEYAYSMRLTMAGNVYSFGVILLELLTGKAPVNGGTELANWVRNNSVHQHKMDQILDFSVVRTSLAVRSQMLSVLKIALACVSVSPDARPKMRSVLRMLLNAR